MVQFTIYETFYCAFYVGKIPFVLMILTDCFALGAPAILKHWKSVLFGHFACMAAFSLFGKIDANAATAVTDLKQTEGSKDSVKLEWNGALDDKKYYLEVSEDQQNWVEKKDLYSSSKTTYVSDLNAGSTYYVRVKTEANDGTAAYSNVIDVVTCPSEGVQNIIQTDATTNSVSLAWDKVENANAYYLEYYDNSQREYVQETITEDTTYTKSGLDTSFVDGTFGVYACRKSEAGFLAKSYAVKMVYNVRTIPGKVTDIKKDYWSRSKSSSTLKLLWTEQERVKGYEIKVYNTKNKCIGTYTASYGSSFISDLSGKTCATVKIRAFIEVNGVKKYGAWSAKKNIVPEVYGTVLKREGSLSLSWQKITGATGYDIYVKTDYNGTYKKVASVSGKKKSYKITKFKGKKIKYSQSYYVAVIAKQKVGGKTYKSSSN